MNPQAISVHAFESHALRVIDRNGEPWFVATDIASVLGYRNTTDMVRMLDDDEKGVHIVRTLGGDQEATIVSESGLYACILKSRREEAKAFRKWVTSEVLPSIRRTGGYQATASSPFPHNLNHRADNLVSADRSFRAAMRSGRSVGLNTAQAIRRAQLITQNLTGVDLLAELGVQAPDLDEEPWGAPDSAQRFVTAWIDLEIVGPAGKLLPLCPVRGPDLMQAYRWWCEEHDEVCLHNRALHLAAKRHSSGWVYENTSVREPGTPHFTYTRLLNPPLKVMAMAEGRCRTGVQGKLMPRCFSLKSDWRGACIAAFRNAAGLAPLN
jgi:hypothetical protein